MNNALTFGLCIICPRPLLNCPRALTKSRKALPTGICTVLHHRYLHQFNTLILSLYDPSFNSNPLLPPFTLRPAPPPPTLHPTPRSPSPTNGVVQGGRALWGGGFRLVLPPHKHIEQVVGGDPPLPQGACRGTRTNE